LKSSRVEKIRPPARIAGSKSRRVQGSKRTPTLALFILIFIFIDAHLSRAASVFA